ncbi:MAG: hypothetical protein OXR73_06775, partial [Myxococcales bacterium]|nr:hypothetical protein [Myxococcales bacterium]
MRAIAIVLSLILLCGCTRGKKKAPEGAAKTPAGETSANEAAADGKAKGGEGLDPAWLAGDLPKTLLEGTPKRGGEVTVQIWSEPPSLNSLRHSDWIASHVANHQIYEALVAMAPYDAPANPSVGE